MVTLQFDEQQLSVLDKCLRIGIYYEVAPLIDSINRQIRAQRMVPVEPPANEGEK